MDAPLNYREIALLAEQTRSRVEGLFLDRIIVPERERAPGGYFKGEWGLRLTGRHDEGVLIFSVRSRHPYFYFVPGKGPKAATQGTRSPFDLEAGKLLKGKKLSRLEALPKERTVVLHFEPDLALALNLIPAAPEAILLQVSNVLPQAALPTDGGTLHVITRSRGKVPSLYAFPDGSKAPADMQARPGLEATSYAQAIEDGLESEAFETRLGAAIRETRALEKQARDRLRQTRTALEEARRDQDWKRMGDLLKASLHDPQPLEKRGKTAVRKVRDLERPEIEAWTEIPADPKLSPAEQVEKYYQLARRKARRISESEARIEGLSEGLRKIEALLASPPEPGNWKALELLERFASAGSGGAPAPSESAGRKKSGLWLGKTFASKDGLTILVGRNKDENLELTFKRSRGNDLWMHVRGKPGAHVLIPLQSGKSAPLETLLDAATLCIHYSGGQNWGKTEVDYTFKKYVKRIKDSTEASYTNNKTLIIEPDPARLKRLLNAQND